MKKNVPQHAVLAFLIVAMTPPPALAAFIDQPVEVAPDMNADGVMDRVVVVPDPESTNVDLSIYLSAGEGKLDPARKPTFHRQGFALDWRLLAVESNGRGSLGIVTGCG